jgi:hypothetical protein
VIYVAEKSNPKFNSRYSFTSIPVSSRRVKLKKRLDLNKMFPAGMGALYSFEFGVGSSSKSNDEARLNYIGLSFTNPTMDRIEGHMEDTKSDKTTLDYLAYAAATRNQRPGAVNIKPFSSMVEVMNIVSIFDLALMERYYIKVNNTQASGRSSYKSFDEMVKDRNFSNGRKFTSEMIPLNTDAGGQGGPILQNVLRSSETSRIITAEDIIFGALAFIEETDTDVKEMRNMYMPNELKNIPSDNFIISKYKLPPNSTYDIILPYKVHYIIETFASIGSKHNAMSEVLQNTIRETQQYRQISGAERSKMIDEITTADKEYDNKFSLQGYFQSLSASKELSSTTKKTEKSIVNVGYISRVIGVSGYDYKAIYRFGNNPDYSEKFKNKNFSAQYSRIYQVDTSKPTMFKYFAQGFLAVMFSDSPNIQKFLSDFDIKLSAADKLKSQAAIKAARKEIMANQKSVMEQLATIELLQLIKDMSKEKNQTIKIEESKLEKLKSKSIADITIVTDRVINILNENLPGGLSEEEKIFLHARIRNIAFAFNVGKITTG